MTATVRSMALLLGMAPLLLGFGAGPLRAELIVGRVAVVASGEVVAMTVGEHRIDISLLGVLAPRHGQARSEESRRGLERVALGMGARAECQGRDERGMLVCKLWVQPADCGRCGLTLDVNHAQVLSGMAWWNRNHARRQSPEDRGRYESAEQEARLRRRGLWQEPSPEPPRDWRER